MLYDRIVRALSVLVLVAGCFGNTAGIDNAKGDDGDPLPPPFGAAPCVANTDCVAAAATCCECPTFATSAGDPKVAACQDVNCPPSSCPDNVEAVCDPGIGFCTLACKAVTCAADATCAGGFFRDDSGCLSCACAGGDGMPLGCRVDTDCVETRADCCGCKQGGIDTAVPVGEVAAFDASLMCPASPQCPGVDTCQPGDEPHCVNGQCELLPALPPGACGTPDLPPCPAGQACVINANDQANLYGVGICQPM